MNKRVYVVPYNGRWGRGLVTQAQYDRITELESSLNIPYGLPRRMTQVEAQTYLEVLESKIQYRLIQQEVG